MVADGEALGERLVNSQPEDAAKVWMADQQESIWSLKRSRSCSSIGWVRRSASSRITTGARCF